MEKNKLLLRKTVPDKKQSEHLETEDEIESTSPRKDTGISTGKATSLSGKPRQTLIRWCQDLGIGKKIAGRWKIDPKKLDDVLEGRLTYDSRSKSPR